MGNKECFCLQTQTWARDSHGLFDYEFKRWHTDDLKLEEDTQIIYRSQDSIKFAQNYSRLKEAKDKAKHEYTEENWQDGVHFSILGFLIKDRNEYRISSVSHYSTYFNCKELLKEKFETFRYEQYGNYSNLKSVGVDGY